MMFPLIETNIENETNENTFQKVKSYIFDFTIGDFVINDGRLVVADSVTAIKVWIEKILRTEKNRFAVYDGLSYGTDISDLIIGTNYSIAFIESELKREIEEALLQHPQISSISGLCITREISSITAEFTVVLKDGTAFENGVNLSVG